MSIDGIWNVEMLGPYGWESIANAFLKNNQYLAASENHYTVGSYEISGNRVEMSAVSVQHGKVRTLFGKKEKQFGIVFEGEIEGDRIQGQTHDELGQFYITFRWTRIADLP